jgi:hypothetical protein
MKKPIEPDPFEEYGREVLGMPEAEKKKFYKVRKEAGRHIDPETAEVAWTYAYVVDPYGIEIVPEEYQCVGREYFARAPGSDMWICFSDLPKAVHKALWEKYHKKLLFPAGLHDLTASFCNPITPESA